MIGVLLLTSAIQGCTAPAPARALGGSESASSPHRRMHLLVVPDPKTNEGKAHYELRSIDGEKEALLWQGDRPFFLQHPFVSDSGWIAGSTAHESDGPQDPATFRLFALDPAGVVKVDDEVRDPRDCGNRTLNGAIFCEHSARILFRVQLPLPRGSESWRAYDTKSGSLASTFRPDARQGEPDGLSWVHGACMLGDRNLVFVHWEKHGEIAPDVYEDATWRDVGSRFALLTLDGVPVWSVDVLSDLGATSYEKYAKLVDRLRGLDCAGILDASHDDRFEVGLIGSGMRVRYALGKLDDGTWNVHETERTKWAPDPADKR